MSASAETFYRAYEAAGGRPVNRAAVAFWSVWGNLRWAILCLAQSRRHLSGHDRSVELASLGRQSAEFQLEMLRLIAEQGVNDDV
jgi:aminoglycoside phosphotransferase (APT) family kinase protein